MSRRPSILPEPPAPCSRVRAMLGVALARRRRLLGRSGAVGGRPRGGGLSADPTALVRRRMAGRRPPARTAGLLAASVVLVDGGPGPTLGFVLRNAALLVA